VARPRARSGYLHVPLELIFLEGRQICRSSGNPVGTTGVRSERGTYSIRSKNTHGFAKCVRILGITTSTMVEFGGAQKKVTDFEPNAIPSTCTYSEPREVAYEGVEVPNAAFSCRFCLHCTDNVDELISPCSCTGVTLHLLTCLMPQGVPRWGFHNHTLQLSMQVLLNVRGGKLCLWSSHELFYCPGGGEEVDKSLLPSGAFLTFVGLADV
jgi:hypothetical protein